MNPEYNESGRPIDAWAKNPLLKELAEIIQPPIRAALELGGPLLRDGLHGTFIGHPLHVMITDIPVGAWSVTAVCDTLDLFGGNRFAAAADTSLAIGAIGAMGAGMTGFADWSDTKDEPQRVGMLHAILNMTALTLYATSLIARRKKARGFGRLTAFAGYALVGASAYLGGELSSGMQLGVKHTAVPIEPPADFKRVLDAKTLANDSSYSAKLEGIPILVTQLDDQVYAVGAVCTHRGAPLAEGERDGDCIACPWHDSRFSLKDGRVLEGPATFPLPVFETRINGDNIEARAAL